MSCKIYPPVACKFLPHEFAPYDDIDPNSIIKYKKNPNYIPSFYYPEDMGKIDVITWLKKKKLVEKFDKHNLKYKFNYSSLFIASLIIVVFILFILFLING